MSQKTARCSEPEALAALLGHTLDPINQLFLHSRMLRARGHSLGPERHREWIEKMRRSRRLAILLIARGVLPSSREDRPLAIGHDAASILESDRRQGLRFAVEAEAVLGLCGDDDVRDLVDEMVEAERTDIVRLEAWLAGKQAREPRRDARHLMPKPGSAAASVAALDALLPPTVAAVSQIFLHSLIFDGQGRKEDAARELQAALRMMYRSEALLERLLDLGAVPPGTGHGTVAIDAGPGGAERTAAAVHRRMHVLLDEHLRSVDPHGDPGTWSLLDGLRRASRDEAEEIAARLAARAGKALHARHDEPASS